MRSPDERVVVTGLGMVTPLGIGHRAFWDGVLAARSTARSLSRGLDGVSHSSFACPVDEGELRWEDYIPNRKALKLMSRATRFAMVASALALSEAGLGPGARDPRRCAVAHGAGGVG